MTGAVVFVHVPKTGGMTLASILARQFRAAAAYQLEGPLTAARQELRRLPLERLRNLRLVGGHVPFGLHECLPRPARYVTLLRDPVERLVSVYYYGRLRPEWPIHRQIHDRGWTLDDFIASDAAAEFHNQQTRMLAGGDGLDDAPGALERALEHLGQHFPFAGLMERFDESVLLYREVLGWGAVHYRPENINRGRPRGPQIPAATAAAIERRNALDRALYEAAKPRFEAALAASAVDTAAVEAFRRQNHLLWSYVPKSRRRVSAGGRG
jgi:hypothetical protein